MTIKKLSDTIICKERKVEEIKLTRLLPYLRNYIKESITGPLFKLLEAIFELIVPVIVARMIDVGIAEKDTMFVWKTCGILVIFGMSGLVCSISAQFFAAKAATGFGTELRNAMFSHIEKLPYSQIDKAGNDTLIVRMTSDINQVQTGVNLVLRLFLRSPFIVAGALFMAFRIDGKTGFVFLVIVPILALVIFSIIIVTIPMYKKVQNSLDEVLCSTRENLTGIRVVRAFGTQTKERAEFMEKSSKLEQLQQRSGKISALMNPLTYIVVNMGIILVVWVGGSQVYKGSLTQGEVIALVNYMTQILLALVALANLIVSFTKAVASAGRINEVFDLPVENKEGKYESDFMKGPLSVRMDKVSFSYEGSKVPALSNISVDLSAGEMVGVIGSTGSGKSSFINLIPALYHVDSGKVLVDGVDVCLWNKKMLRKSIGIVPQKTVLFRGSLRENIKMGREEISDEKIIQSLKAAQAWEFVSEKSEGLDWFIQEGGKNLSGGQRQRLTIARALAGNPKILILDDSTSALDFATERKVRKELQRLAGKCTIFIVSQRAASVMHADKILVLENGEMAGCDTHDNLLRECSVYQEICASQLLEKEECQI